jgi:hypothetical protein
MIPRYNIKQIKNKLEGNTRWLDYIPPVLNFEPPRTQIQSNMVLDQSDFSFLKEFNATFDSDTDYPLLHESDELTDLGRVLLKSVDLILPDFDWQWITSEEDQFYSIADDLIVDFDNGRYNIGTMTTYEDDDNDIVYELQIDVDDPFQTHFYDADMEEISELPEPQGQWVETVNSLYIDVDEDAWDSIEFSFDPSSGLSVSLKNYFPTPYRFFPAHTTRVRWSDDPVLVPQQRRLVWDEVYISPAKLLEIKRQLLDKVQSTGFYIDDPEVYKFIYAGAIDKNQLSLFGDWDG